jgi:hypothetical protein
VLAQQDEQALAIGFGGQRTRAAGTGRRARAASTAGAA